MRYKMIPVALFWSQWRKGQHREHSRTLVRVEQGGETRQDFAFVMDGFFDHPRGAGFGKWEIKFVLIEVTKKA